MRILNNGKLECRNKMPYTDRTLYTEHGGTYMESVLRKTLPRGRTYHTMMSTIRDVPSLCGRYYIQLAVFISEEKAVVLSIDLSEVRSLPGKESKAGFLDSTSFPAGSLLKVVQLSSHEAFRSVLTPDCFAPSSKV